MSADTERRVREQLLAALAASQRANRVVARVLVDRMSLLTTVKDTRDSLRAKLATAAPGLEPTPPADCVLMRRDELEHLIADLTFAHDLHCANITDFTETEREVG